MITLRSFYPQDCINGMTLTDLQNKYTRLKNRMATGYILWADTLLVEALKNEIDRRTNK